MTDQLVGHETIATPSITEIRLQQCGVQAGTAVLSCSSCCIAELAPTACANSSHDVFQLFNLAILSLCNGIAGLLQGLGRTDDCECGPGLQ